MKEKTKNRLASCIIYFGVPLLGILLMENIIYQRGNEDLDKRLNSKVEVIADTNQDGTLSIEEMERVYLAIKKDPVKRLHNSGFNLTIEESQRYLKSQGKFNPETDQNDERFYHVFF